MKSYQHIPPALNRGSCSNNESQKREARPNTLPLGMMDFAEEGIGNQDRIDMLSESLAANGGDACLAEDESSPSRTDLPADLVRKAEKTTGESLHGLTIDDSAEAQEEVAAVGGTAAAVDGEILLGSTFPGTDTAMGREILLHEMAHVAGGQNSKQDEIRLQGRPRADAQAELAADSVASSALAGAPTPLQAPSLDRGEVGLWNSAEHHELGNKAYQDAANLSVVKLPEDVVGGNSNMTFGEASALSGDFISTPGELLGMDQAKTDDKLDFMQEIDDSWSKLDVAWTSIVEDRNNGIPFVTDAFHNSNHFYPLVHSEYATQHKAAVDLAKTAHDSLVLGNDSLYDAARRQALTQEAFASHFLQDAFAAGHQYPCADSINSITRMNFHDEINELSNGLPMTDGERHHGDGKKTSTDDNSIVALNSASIEAVMLRADQGGGGETTAQILSSLPGPDESAILADKDAAPVWKALSKDQLNLDAGSIASADPLTGRGMPGSDMEDDLSSNDRLKTGAGTGYAMDDASAEVYEVMDQSTSLGSSLQTEEKPNTGGRGGLATRGSLVLTILQDMGMTLGLTTWASVGARAIEAGILNDVWKTSFMNAGDSPDLRLFDPVTRSEAAVMVQRAYGIANAGPEDVEAPFTDLDGVEWAKGAIYGLVKEGWVHGYGDGRFGPADNLQAGDQMKLISGE